MTTPTPAGNVYTVNHEDLVELDNLVLDFDSVDRREPWFDDQKVAELRELPSRLLRAAHEHDSRSDRLRASADYIEEHFRAAAGGIRPSEQPQPVPSP